MQTSRHQIVVLLTDFGLDDPYVGIVKGVILSMAPGITIVDLCHGISPQDVTSGAFALACSYRYFPRGSVFMAVVDPGVGSGRRAIAASLGGYLFVAPDNGILTGVFAEEECASCREIRNEELFLRPVSRTFHARDVFAPVAAHLALGGRLEDLGPEVADPVLVDWPEARVEGGRITGVVLARDRFGNLVTNIRGELLPSGHVGVEINGMVLPLVGTYADVEAGRPLALVGSAGYLEISANMADASSLTGAGPGTSVTVLDRA